MRKLGESRGPAGAGWLLLAAIAAAHFPLALVYAGQLWSTPHYQFFPLLLMGATCIAWRALRRIGPSGPERLVTACGGFAAAQLILLFAVLWNSPWAGWIALLVAMLSCVYTCTGWRGVAGILPSWLLLWTLVRMPLNLDGAFVLRLQSVTALACGGVLDVLGVLHRMSGHVIELPGQKLLVAEACSGIHSLFSLLACTAFYAAWHRIPILRCLFLLAATVFWVGIANVTRIVSVTILAGHGITLPDGWPHELLGVLFFLVTVFMVWSSNQLFSVLLTRDLPKPEERVEGDRDPLHSAARHDTRGALPALAHPAPRPTGTPGIKFACLAISFVYLVLTSGQLFALAGPARATHDQISLLARLTAADLPRQNDWKLQGFTVERRESSSRWGQHSRVWHYDYAGLIAAIALDYPYYHWHDVTQCYEAQGWSVTRRYTHRPSDDFDGDVFEFRAQPPEAGRPGTHALCAMLDDRLHPCRMNDRLSDRIKNRFDRSRFGRNRTVQVRLMIESDTPLSDAHRFEARQFLRLVCRHLSQRSQQGNAADEERS